MDSGNHQKLRQWPRYEATPVTIPHYIISYYCTIIPQSLVTSIINIYIAIIANIKLHSEAEANEVTCAGTAAPSNIAELHFARELLALAKYQLPESTKMTL